jgi:hypothetical protein
MRSYLLISTILLPGLLLAQEDQLAQRFAQLDANDDGKLSAEEAPWPRFFERADADGDGFVTLGEARAALGRHQVAELADDTERGMVSLESRYLAGRRDANGEWMGGTDTMRLVAHKGALYAAISYWTDQPGNDPSPGAQVWSSQGQTLTGRLIAPSRVYCASTAWCR